MHVRQLWHIFNSLKFHVKLAHENIWKIYRTIDACYRSLKFLRIVELNFFPDGREVDIVNILS